MGHLSQTSLWQIAEAIDEELRERLAVAVRAADYIAVSVDESDSVGGTEYLSIEVYYVAADVSFERNCSFGMLMPVGGDQGAEFLHNKVCTFFVDTLRLSEEEVAAKLVSFDADGAAVNTGVHAGLGVLLSGSIAPFVVGMHDPCQRVSLMAKPMKQVPLFSRLETLCSSTYS